MYFSLHNHTDYSNLKLIDSINRVEDLIDRAHDIGLTGLAITDHDALSGHVRAIQHYKKKYKDSQFKMALGNEIYLTREGLTSETHEKGEHFYHVILVAKDKIGHDQLRELSSRAWTRGYVRAIMRTPTYMSDLLEVIGNNPGHIVATSACLGGVPGRAFLSTDITPGEKVNIVNNFIASMSEVFGEDFYVELQPSHTDEQIGYNKFMIEQYWGRVPFVFATDSHYLKKEDRKIHKYFLNSKEGDREVDAFYASAYMMDYNELGSYFNSYVPRHQLEEMRDNTNKVYEQVEFYDLKNDQIVPSIPTEFTEEMIVAEGKMAEVISSIELKSSPRSDKFHYIKKYALAKRQEDAYFFGKIVEGFYDLIGEPTKEYLERLEYELEQLWETSITIGQPISSYFNTMAKMIDIIWEEGDSIVGVSRGSAAGFLVNYCLGITQLDPLKQELEMPAWRLA